MLKILILRSLVAVPGASAPGTDLFLYLANSEPFKIWNVVHHLNTVGAQNTHKVNNICHQFLQYFILY